MIDLDGKEGIRTIQNYGLTKEDFENPMVQQQVKEAQAIYNLNMIANSPNFQNKMKESYELSFNNTTGEIREVSSTIIIKKNQVDLINIEVGGASGANLNLTTGANEQLIGSLHNHPYIREELENMAKKFNLVSKSTGTPPSVTDVKTAAYNFQTSQTIIVDEGSKLYAIYIINHEKALDLALTLGEIEAQILDDIETGKIKSDSIQDALMQGILNYFDSPDSGMLFLESKDRENPNFEIIKNKNYE